MTPPGFPEGAVAAARDAVKAHLRINGNREDALLAGHAAAALALCESFTGTAWIAREWSEAVAADGRWHRLSAAPVSAISAAEGQAIDIDARGEGWVRARGAAPVRVTYQAGAVASWSALPAPIAQGVVLLAAHLFEARPGDAPPAAVTALWRPWRRMRIAGEGVRA